MQSSRDPEQVLYNHEKENFELLNGPSTNTKSDYRSILPARFLAKMQKISNQIDFINK